MASSISSTASSLPTGITDNQSATSAEQRITKAERLSITPETQKDSAAILSITRGATALSADISLGSLIYNSAVARSRTGAQLFASDVDSEAQTQALIDKYSPKPGTDQEAEEGLAAESQDAEPSVSSS